MEVRVGEASEFLGWGGSMFCDLEANGNWEKEMVPNLSQ
jgi:hypothetical protein